MNKIKKPTKEEVQAVDLSPLYPLLTNYEERLKDRHGFTRRNYLERAAGVEHYKLLGWFSKQFDGVTLTEIGTLDGMGLIALSLNQANNVVSWDIKDYKWKNDVPANGVRKIVYDGYMDEVVKSPVIFYDAQHEGREEKEFLDELLKRNYSGIVIWDDIHLNPAMEEFWQTHILNAQIDAQDWTDIGHSCGTGVTFL